MDFVKVGQKYLSLNSGITYEITEIVENRVIAKSERSKTLFCSESVNHVLKEWTLVS